jgi:hypothetical protein
MKSNDDKVRPAETARRAGDYDPPTLTVIGDIRELVMGVPGAAWDHQGYSDPLFEFQADGEET